MKAITIGDGHHDPHYPSWGFGHIVRISEGQSIGRMVRVFHDERLPLGTTIEFDRVASLPRVVSADSMERDAS